MKVDLPDNCMGLDPGTIRGPCAFGCDIRPGSWDLLVGDILKGKNVPHVIRPVFVGKVRDEADVMFVARQYRCRFGVCDTRPETTLAARLQVAARGYGMKVWRAQYNNAPTAIEVQENSNEMLLTLDRTMALDHVHMLFQFGKGVALPANFQEITHGEFVRELTTPSRVPTKWNGKECSTWVGLPDHTMHAWQYLYQAMRRGNMLIGGGEACAMSVPGLVRGMGDKPLIQMESGRSEVPKIEVDWDKVEADDDEQDGVFWEA
jgi:hypothetical protein